MTRFRAGIVLAILMATALSGCMIGVSNNTFSNIEYVKQDQYAARTRVEVMEKLGQPLRTEKLPNGHEKYVYSGSLAWRGVVGIVILPVPLLLPVGFNELYYEFKGERLVHVTSEEMGSRFYGCMFPPFLKGELCGAPM
jgi:hypothetical protein